MTLDWENLFPQVAHDIRALARKGAANAQLLERLLGPSVSPEAATHIQAIIRSQFDLNSFVARLMLLLESVSARPDDETAELETVVLGAKLECRAGLEKAGGELIVESLPEVTLFARTQTILVELVSNSLRYTDPERKPRIVISARLKEPELLEIRVSDNGAGVHAGYEDKLFQPMQRLESRSGSGLGLAVAKALTDSANGKIHYEHGHPGADFIVELPVVAG